jgi:hypothetical protein
MMMRMRGFGGKEAAAQSARKLAAAETAPPAKSTIF